jgi:hypothetical protein
MIIFDRFQEFLRRYSRRLKLLFAQQSIFLVNDSQYRILIDDLIHQNQEILCEYCGETLTPEKIQGWFFDEFGNTCFLCGRSECHKHTIKEG